jgi:glycosyltransferase involved in cell wall biosynthesis
VNPLVTCVCPTTGSRSSFLQRAVNCFAKQTYDNAELLIVTDDAESVRKVFLAVFGLDLGHPVESFSVEWPKPLRCIVAPAGLKLGAKRNFANEQATGKIICHFDDDDYSAPGRIADQVQHLASSALPATGYSRMKFTDGASWWRYKDPLFPLGTSLCYWKSWWETHRFYDVQVGSDTLLIHAAQLAGEVSAVDCGDMMFARVHGGNTNKTPKWETSAWEALSPEEAVTCA